MSYLVDLRAGASLAELKARHQAYRSYIQSAKRPSVPAYDFALASWHYEPSDPRCPHDAWVESLCILEPASGERLEVRSLEVRLQLMGAYHDGRIRLTYPGVRRYSLFQPEEDGLGPTLAKGHGDWLIDEVRTSDNGRPDQRLVVHEILFSRQGIWTIEAEDILYEWLPE